MTPEQNKAILTEFLSYARDPEKLHLTPQFLTPDFKRHDVFKLFPFRTGLNAVQEHMSQGFTAFPDLQIDIIDMLADRDCVVLRYFAHGTHKGELFGWPPTGNPVKWEAINVYRFEDGKVAETWQYMDALGILRQIGALPQEHR